MSEEIEKLVKPFGAAIELALRGDRTLKSHFREVAKKTIETIRNPKTRAGQIARQVSMVVAAILIFGWFPYRPLTPCMLVPGNSTQSLAAYDMQLTEAKVHSGRFALLVVKFLAKFDTRQLDLQRAGLISQLEQAEVDVRKSARQEGTPLPLRLPKPTRKSSLHSWPRSKRRLLSARSSHQKMEW